MQASSKQTRLKFYLQPVRLAVDGHLQSRGGFEAPVFTTLKPWHVLRGMVEHEPAQAFGNAADTPSTGPAQCQLGTRGRRSRLDWRTGF